MHKTVVIDCFPESVRNYKTGYAIVAVDVIRATTTAITGVAMGRRCFPVPSIEAAFLVAATLEDPLLAGELEGRTPDNFDITNSPAELAPRTDIYRPLVLLSSSGTKVLYEAKGCDAVYLGCFRNHIALARYLTGRYPQVAVIGAGSRGEFREEDQMCCAWIAGDLMDAGYMAKDSRTSEIVERWKGALPDACVNGKSAQYLKNSGQLRDLDFILANINDLDSAFMLKHDEIVMLPPDKPYEQTIPMENITGDIAPVTYDAYR